MHVARQRKPARVLVQGHLFVVVALCHTASAANPSAERPAIDVYTSWQTFDEENGLPDRDVRALHVFQNTLWVGTADGLARFDGQVWRSWTDETGLPARAVCAIDVDRRTHDVWLGTWGDGLIRFTGGRFDRFDQRNSGLAGNFVFAVQVDGDHIWAATNGGVSRFNVREENWSLFFERRADRAEIAMTDLAVVDGSLLAAAWRGNLHQFDPVTESWSLLEVPDHIKARDGAWKGVPLGEGQALGVAGDVIWHATSRSLLRRDVDDTWRRRLLPAGEGAGTNVNCVVSTDPTDAWLGTETGLKAVLDWQTGTWVTYQPCARTKQGLITVTMPQHAPQIVAVDSTFPDGRVRCLAVDADGIWVGTARGLARGSNRQSFASLESETAVTGTDTVAASCTATAGGAEHEGGTDSPGTSVAAGTMAIFGPRSRTIALPGGRPRRVRREGLPDLLAVQLAVQDANERGARQLSSRFELVMSPIGYGRYGWGLPEDDFAVLLSKPKVLGVVGKLEPRQRLTTYVAGRSGLPFVDVAALDSTATDVLRYGPWLFRCWGDQPRQMRLLMDYVFDQLGHKRGAVLRTPGSAARPHLEWCVRHARHRDQSCVIDLTLAPNLHNLLECLSDIQDRRTDFVLTWSDTQTTVTILREMRAAGMTQTLVASGDIVVEDLADAVGRDPGEVLSAYSVSRGRLVQPRSDFVEAYKGRNVVGRVPTPPDSGAYASYIATDHLLDAITRACRRHAAPGREDVRDALSAMSHRTDGEAHFERMHERGSTIIARIEEGRWRFITVP